MSKILEGLDKAASRQVQNIVRQNPTGSAAEKMLLQRFIKTPVVQDFDLSAEEWIGQATKWLAANQNKIKKNYPEIDTSDLIDLATKMYEDFLAMQGKLEEGLKGAVGGWITGGPVGAYVGHKGQQLINWLRDPKNQEEVRDAYKRMTGKTDDVPATPNVPTTAAADTTAATGKTSTAKPKTDKSTSKKSSVIIDPSTGKPFQSAATTPKPKVPRTKKEPKVAAPKSTYPSLDAEPGRTIGGGYQDTRWRMAPVGDDGPELDPTTSAKLAQKALAGSAAGGVVGGIGYNMYKGSEEAYDDALTQEPEKVEPTPITISPPQRKPDEPAGFIAPNTQAELDAQAAQEPDLPELSDEERAEAEKEIQKYRYGDLESPMQEDGATMTAGNLPKTLPTKNIKTALKDIGKKAIPVAGTAFYVPDIIDRTKKGDYTGAGISTLGAALSLLPGKAAGVGLVPDAINMARDTGVSLFNKDELSPIARGIKEADKSKKALDTLDAEINNMIQNIWTDELPNMMQNNSRFLVYSGNSGLELDTNSLDDAIYSARLLASRDLDSPAVVFDRKTKFPVKIYSGSEEMSIDKNKLHEGDVVKGPWKPTQQQLPLDTPSTKTKAPVVGIPSAPKFQIVNMYKEFIGTPQFRSLARKGFEDDDFLSLAADYIESKLGTMKPVELYRQAEKFLQVHKATQNASKMFENTIQNIASLNKLADVNKIIAGKQLMLPNQTVYVIKPGDTLSQIALDYAKGSLPVIDTTTDEFQNQLAKTMKANIEKDLSTNASNKFDTAAPSGKFADTRNNPGNLRFYKGLNKPGYVLDKAIGVDDKGFAIFASPKDGLDAMQRQLALDTQKRGMTGKELINKYAPASDNNQPDVYVSNVFGQLGLDPDSKISKDDLRRIQQLMVRQEHGKEGMYHYYPETNPKNTMANLNEMEVLQRFLDRNIQQGADKLGQKEKEKASQEKPVPNPNARYKTPGEPKSAPYDISQPAKPVDPIEVALAALPKDIEDAKKLKQQSQKPVREYKSSIMKGLIKK